LLRFGELEIDFVRRSATLSGAELRLAPVEHSLLYLLVVNADRVLSRDAILSALWGPAYIPGSNVVDRHVRELRTKLHDDWHQPRFIATVPGEGYRFVGTGVAARPQGLRLPTQARTHHPRVSDCHDESKWRESPLEALHLSAA
jgi:DNA-binding winged helix-turn-helix (wHTH) protein